METESNFIHTIANYIATARLSLEIGIEELEVKKTTSTETVEMFTKSIKALDSLSKALEERRKALMNTK